jgi:hypothetical protein
MMEPSAFKTSVFPDLRNGLGNQMNAVAAALVYVDTTSQQGTHHVVLDLSRVRNKHAKTHTDLFSVARFWLLPQTNAIHAALGSDAHPKNIAGFHVDDTLSVKDRMLRRQHRRGAADQPVLVKGDSAHLFLEAQPSFPRILDSSLQIPSLATLSAPLKDLTSGWDAEDLSRAVFLHVRRGDFVSNPAWRAILHVDLMRGYYPRALRLARERLGDSLGVLVCSDDPAWCATHLPAVFVEAGVDSWRITEPTASAADTLILMAHCGRGGIGANSSLSFWGVCLNFQRHVRSQASRANEHQPQTLWSLPSATSNVDGILRLVLPTHMSLPWLQRIDKSRVPSSSAQLRCQSCGHGDSQSVAVQSVILAVLAIVLLLVLIARLHRNHL